MFLLAALFLWDFDFIIYVCSLALQAQNLPMDYFTFAFTLWNFAVVGILAVFYYVPRVLTQAYLVAVSALMGALAFAWLGNMVSGKVTYF